MVLATDMSHHFEGVGQLKGRLASNDFNPKNSDKQTVLNFLMHAADISNPAKKWDLCKTWAEKIMNEFFL